MLARMWNIGTCVLLVGMKMEQVLWKSVWQVLKVKHRTVIRPSSSTPRYIDPNESETNAPNRHLHIFVHSSLKVEVAEMSTN